MKQSHTPGPWSLESDGSLVMNNQVVGSAPSPDTATKEEAKANAALIAAAPSLLESAEALLHHLEQEPQYGCFDGFGKRDQANTRDFYNSLMVKPLVQAIAKARGE